ncbi:putative ribose/galactose/methyl galactoside imp ort ATP-binding protein [Micromonospora saelicesensis]|uniref:Ribose/galactose/methyl galactoside imp ort ATP-binding protein n=1 Tax=Micromonospora saelicesensis TaxID=285676 RepID=A0ABX9CLM1_9ACTN|nr:ATP-binding cassette domain-containing protein [Micromonospora saelicesensis]RAO00268.1 putative ribose/galactose/methyl galactoside imp ort ATP-binding protein [Micromonospora saelicesensis]RAO60694.1 putative ribose/galactose/methyl galactoside imp ort ATP-binding protein [Micromonospora saelicesensis]
MTRADAIVAQGLRKRYRDRYALDGFDLRVPQGTVCGLLGPNGAGKTTSVRILSTLLRLDEGRAEVAGFDVTRQPDQVRYRIGLVGQHPALDEALSGRQNLVLFGRLFHLGRRRARQRAVELLERFGLADAAEQPVSTYSGGMRRRLDLAAGMILAPAVLFLDEPTTGLDPRGRNEVWESVRELVRTGTTVLLTTQQLDEADQLADRISVVEAGRVIAEGTPDDLKTRLGGDRIEVVVAAPTDLAAAVAQIRRAADDEPTVDVDRRMVSVRVGHQAGALVDVLRALDAVNVPVADVALRRPTLDDVFLHLTGHRAATAEVAA